MCVIYLLTDGRKLCKNGGRIEIQDGDRKKLYSLPIHDVGNIVVAAKIQITYDVIKTALLNNISITYLDQRGEIIGTLRNEKQTIDYLLQQHKCFNDEEIALTLTRLVLAQKLQAQEKIISSYARTMNKPELKQIAKSIKIYTKKINSIDKISELRGLEGISSRSYFSGFSAILADDSWGWKGRNRRPSLDPVNSLLSYGYAFLEGEVRIGIAGARLDERIGFLHSNNGRKDSLVYDLMEMFRHRIVDKFTFMLIKKHIFTAADFEYDENNGCRIKTQARKRWIDNYEEYISRERQLLGGLSWRSYIFKEIEHFADVVRKFG